MPRRAKGPRLHLRPARADRDAVWVILDRGKEKSTGCFESDREGADIALAAYLTEKYEPPRTGGKLAKTLIVDVMTLYLQEQGPLTADGGAWIGYMAAPIGEWWADKTLANVNKSNCTKYVDWRTGQGVSDQTARHELKTLRAAINHYHASDHGPLTAVPIVTLPAKAPQKVDYWLTRKQVADRIRAARRRKRSRHVIRLLLIGVYTGTRPGATKALRWVASATGGWFDLESETLHRRALGRKQTKKLQPPARIHARLLPHLRRWRKADMDAKITNVIHYYGKQIGRIDNAWESVAIEAGHATWVIDSTRAEGGFWRVNDGPHICRHTAATWQMQNGTDRFEAAGYLGMSPDTLWDTYGHHSPAFQSNASKAGGRRSAHETPKLPVNADRTNRVSNE